MEIKSYTVNIGNSTNLLNWVIIRGPQYRVTPSNLISVGGAEYILCVF